MIRTRFASAIALAAFLAVPAFAQSTTTTTQADVSKGTTSVDGAYVAPLEKNSAKQQAQGSPGKTAKADTSTSMAN